MRFLVTGGAGFIGSNLTEALLERGDQIVILDNLHTGNQENLKGLNIKFVQGTSSEIVKVKDKLDGIFHLGIPSSSPMYKENPSLINQAIGDFLNILEYARKTSLKVVFASSSSIYNGNDTPYREDMSIKVMDYYTEARYAMERLAELYHKQHGVRTVALRLFSVYGPKEKFKGKFANVVSQFLWDMKAGKHPVIFGDGTQTRDYIFVKDVVKGFLLAMDKDVSGVFNLGTGKTTSFNDTVGLINKVLGTSIEVEYVKNPIKNYVQDTLADTSKSEKELGFKANFTLEQGLKEITS